MQGKIPPPPSLKIPISVKFWHFFVIFFRRFYFVEKKCNLQYFWWWVTPPFVHLVVNFFHTFPLFSFVENFSFSTLLFYPLPFVKISTNLCCQERKDEDPVCQHWPHFVHFFVKFYTWRGKAKIPPASSDHLLCTDTNDLGEISGRGGVCINKIAIQRYKSYYINCWGNGFRFNVDANITERRPNRFKVQL